jgi:NAD(P)-dependent dehydrogenase (short-subunit alcohol dehydrogenase family)
MDNIPLNKKLILITGAAKRIGRTLALSCAQAGADVIIHYGHSKSAALDTQNQIKSMGRQAWILAADLTKPDEISDLILEVSKIGSPYALINSASLFGTLTLKETSLSDWEKHIAVNLTAPFLLSQGFARLIEKNIIGRIVNILDWRAFRPGADHFPYTVSKAGLAALTKSLAVALAPNIIVNGLALGAILPPEDQPVASDILKFVPASRWGSLQEIGETLIFLLTGPTYLTGDIINLDGGRHLI